MFQNVYSINPGDCIYTCSSFSPDGSRIVIGSNHGHIYLYETNTFSLIFSKKIHERAINDIKWALNGSNILTASEDATLILFSSNDFTQLRVYSDFEHPFTKCDVSPSGNIVAAITIEQLLVLWNEYPHQYHNFELIHSDLVTSLQFTRDGKSLLTSSMDGLCRIWDSDTFYLLKTISFPIPISSSIFSPNESFIIIATMDSKIHFYDFVENKTIGFLIGHKNKEKLCSLHNVITGNGQQQVVIQGDNGNIICWDLRTQNILWKLDQIKPPLIPFNITLDGKLIMTSSKDGTVMFWRRNGQ
ncbi:COMPASS-like H3K4 histone methylase component WDR5A [Histomonas meleagridis]|uniref:COMPASS-like H3K4 histone methylase component WDR5A n=1 Tax=Histomonas meleagridis TaxID=135588 RepID=UPI00355AC988|nr:COMPASS-like H3K4 histone methylase component WDR5A [Histomonas meleagridis]KAH0800923.1 COMPASS-like H3K4 histone methylase component WDR5A [Histomonas meleagridis]